MQGKMNFTSNKHLKESDIFCFVFCYEYFYKFHKQYSIFKSNQNKDFNFDFIL